MALGTGLVAVAPHAYADDEAPAVMSDWGGARTRLREDKGITVGLNYIAETLAVTRGGINRRASFEGRFEFVVDTDLEKLTGLPQFKGASTHVKIFQIHNGGHNAAANVGSIADPSNIDALATTRLFTAWYQQELYDGFYSLRVGQLAADDEFFTSETAGGLINGTFGWGGILAANITNGGPAYPLATPGARVAIKATDKLTLLGGVFAGDPAGRNCTIDPQRCNYHGTTFSLSGGALFMGEMQYAIIRARTRPGFRACTNSACGMPQPSMAISALASIRQRVSSCRRPIRHLPPIRCSIAAIGVFTASSTRWCGAGRRAA